MSWTNHTTLVFDGKGGCTVLVDGNELIAVRTKDTKWPEGRIVRQMGPHMAEANSPADLVQRLRIDDELEVVA